MTSVPAAKKTLSSLGDLRILVVDDQTANLRVLTDILEFAGYSNIKCLSDPREVLGAVADFQPDLILLDFHMPHLDGLAVMDQLNGVIPADDYLPVLMLTGDGSSDAKQQALARGASDFLSKPLNLTEVGLRVRNLLHTRFLHCQLAKCKQSLRETQAQLAQAAKLA